jgi:hypothetical protein
LVERSGGWLWETQIARWKKDDLSAAQRQEVERLDGQLAKVRETIDSILDLAKELSEGTIEKILAKSDFELGLEILLGKRKLMTTKERRQHTQKGAKVSGVEGGFRLPPDVSFNKQSLPYGWAYVFRHRSLGELGRIVLQEAGDGRTHLSFEVVGDPADPMTAERAAIFQPLGMELARQMEAATGPAADAASVRVPPRPPEPKELVESRLIPCERCGRVVAMLIFAPQATDAGGFEDYARKMYPEYTRLNLPTWIIGPALGSGPPIDRPAEILKIWPAREPMQRQRPAEFNSMLDRLITEHCGLR